MWSGYSCSAVFIGGVADRLGFDRPTFCIPFSAGLCCRYPRCRIGKRYNRFLVVSDIYKYCHLALKAGAIGDRLAMFVMFIIAPIAAGLALWIGLVFLLPL